jgi:hypothetical protein
MGDGNLFNENHSTASNLCGSPFLTFALSTKTLKSKAIQ